jgi:SagB-type dehydrogenase family enzyme
MPTPTDSTDSTDPAALLADYHQRTKHHFRRSAAGPGGLDWASQPDPFRTYAGCTRLPLPLLAESSDAHLLRYTDLYRPGAVVPAALARESIAALLELALGLSAWKQAGATRWALRCNPSSGNLHPTEAYVVLDGVADIPDGVHHYLSRDHLLEQRCHFNQDVSRRTNEDAFLLGLTSIHWREAWKYGERAYRYCQHDAGHAVAAVRYAAAVLGWNVRVLANWADADIGALLGVDRASDFEGAEAEHPDVLLLVSRSDTHPTSIEADFEQLICAAREATWHGKANRLSPHHLHDWPVIDQVAAACIKPKTRERHWQPPALPASTAAEAGEYSAVQVIKQRRSAQELDARTSIPAARLFRMLDRLLPRPGVAPWDALPWQPRIHPVLFVHRVDGLVPGLYLLVRLRESEALLRAQLSAEFEWEPVSECPRHVRLFRLMVADTRNAARTLSCHQDIAADGAFSLGMLAEFEGSLTGAPWAYRRLFWEAGMLGHVLYLEAEAAGLRGTGIGCYFDDAVHEVLGLKGLALQSMYHFTLGGALEDLRLQTLPPYAHLRQN